MYGLVQLFSIASAAPMASVQHHEFSSTNGVRREVGGGGAVSLVGVGSCEHAQECWAHEERSSAEKVAVVRGSKFIAFWADWLDAMDFE